MLEVRLDYQYPLNELIENWENSLDSNHDDYELVDNEEGDYGIVRYYGADVNGNQNVHLITRYVHGGDSEESFYTEAGRAVAKKIYMDNFESVIDKCLADSVDPGECDGLFHGWKKDEVEAAEIAERENRKFYSVLHPGYAEAFPKQIVGEGLYRFGYRYFVAVVKNPTLGDKESVYFYNIVNPAERLAIKMKEGDGMFKAHREIWSLGFGRREIVVARTDLHDRNQSPVKAPL